MNGDVRVLAGDCLDVMAVLDEASVDAVVTDPPYGLEFMGSTWDAPWKDARIDKRGIIDPATWAGSRGNPYSRARIRTGASHYGGDPAAVGKQFQRWCESWAEQALRVLKPGGHLVSFGGTRMFHRLICGLEDAGWEIRDVLSWLYGSGFPKSQNLDGEWEGWGTALKPGWEPIVLARKPLDGTVVGNVSEHGTGALHIDAARIALQAGDDATKVLPPDRNAGEAGTIYRQAGRHKETLELKAQGRWPANVVLDEHAAELLNAQTGDRKAGSPKTGREPSAAAFSGRLYGAAASEGMAWDGYGDTGGASRFFYCAKAPRSEKPWQQGQVGKEHCSTCSGWEYGNPSCVCDSPTWVRNDESTMHPTVKPLDLMRWLVRLVTPPGGVILDPFAGTGTTGEAALIERFGAVLIEREPDYLALIDQRLSKPLQPTLLA